MDSFNISHSSGAELWLPHTAGVMHKCRFCTSRALFAAMATGDHHRVAATRASGNIPCVPIIGRHLWKSSFLLSTQSEIKKSDLCGVAPADPCRGPGRIRGTSLEMQHAINGHLLWISHSKMSPRLQAATFLSLCSPGSEATPGRYYKTPAARHVHASFMGWQQQHTHTLDMIPGKQKLSNSL